MWRLVGVARHGQACAGTVDNTVSSGEITEATDNVHCRAAYFRFTVGKIPIRIDANGRSGGAMLRPSTTLFSGRIGRMRDFFRKSMAPLSEIRKTKGLAGVGSGNSEPFFPDILNRSVAPGKGSSNFSSNFR